MPSVKEQVKDKLLGTTVETVEPPATKETRASFMKYAEHDDETGDWYLDETNFIDAVAPENEDYVSPLLGH
jgi:solute carrier family 25 (mitochondrial aspartate/glutamate transporter), member 12/13